MQLLLIAGGGCI